MLSVLFAIYDFRLCSLSDATDYHHLPRRLQGWIIASIIKCGVKLLIHSQTSTVPLKYGTKYFHHTLYWAHDYIFVLGSKLIHVSKRIHGWHFQIKQTLISSTPRWLECTTLQHQIKYSTQWIDYDKKKFHMWLVHSYFVMARSQFDMMWSI